MADEKCRQSPSIAPVVKALDDLFDTFNNAFFNSALLKPVITLSEKGTKFAKGWCTAEKVWARKEGDQVLERYYEINLCPEYLNEPVEEICEVLLHEMVHLFNIMNGVQDCSSNGQYHNRKFKESAEKHGLKAEKMARYGYAQTSLKPETIEFIKKLDLTVFDLYRTSAQRHSQGSAENTSTTKQSSTRSYICPKCQTLIRATKEVRVKCENCDVSFIEREQFEQMQAGIFHPILRKK